MKLNRFTNQVAMITGAASGIGQACAVRFAQEGANIACLDFDAARNKETAALCRSHGVEALAIKVDVTQPEDLHRAVETTLAAWGRIDVLVASAGIYSGGPLAEVPLSQWQRLIDINLTGVFLSNQAVAPHLIKQRSGSIINISSMAGKTSWPASAEYSASKSGVIGLTRSVAMELAPYGATCNAVCPGNTLTDMVRNVAGIVGPQDGVSAEEWLQARANDCPMKRMAEPWEIAGVVAFLASEDSRYLTGQAIEVDGGMIMS
ncbi:MAG: SDR family oxidoreductase [Caldilineales bacterium]|nr:SDR family oxidoreductase [Caldilineales bacterium]